MPAHAHKGIRPCYNCRHTPKINKENPSAHNHHGKGSFCRFHKSPANPAVRKYCRPSYVAHQNAYRTNKTGRKIRFKKRKSRL